jgi:hypothetical protein
MSGEARETETLEQSLARLEKLTAALEGIADEKGREAARELLALVLDLHARSLARLSAIIAASATPASKIVGDRASGNIVLHGPYLQSVEDRLQDVIAHAAAMARAAYDP